MSVVRHLRRIARQLVRMASSVAGERYTYLQYTRYARTSYSQEGEDMILARYFGDQQGGFYVDVGAHHPARFSNTYHFYRKGWRGINIDAMPGSMALFHQTRPRDINLELGISEVGGQLEYYQFDEPALNGFSVELAQERTGIQSHTITKRTVLPTYPLKEILAQHLPAGVEIDFLTIDVEGLDIEVLRSNDWERFRPRLVLVEHLMPMGWTNTTHSELLDLMAACHYTFFGKTVNTVFFTREALP